MLSTRCILEPAQPSDGKRISVMSRHTLNDGVTPDARIAQGVTHDMHWPDLAPHPRQVGAFYRGEIDWSEFEEAFVIRLASESAPYLKKLVQVAVRANCTILCVEATPEFCHRRIVAEQALILEPNLIVNLR